MPGEPWVGNTTGIGRKGGARPRRRRMCRRLRSLAGRLCSTVATDWRSLELEAGTCAAGRSDQTGIQKHQEEVCPLAPVWFGCISTAPSPRPCLPPLNLARAVPSGPGRRRAPVARSRTPRRLSSHAYACAVRHATRPHAPCVRGGGGTHVQLSAATHVHYYSKAQQRTLASVWHVRNPRAFPRARGKQSAWLIGAAVSGQIGAGGA